MLFSNDLHIVFFTHSGHLFLDPLHKIPVFFLPTLIFLISTSPLINTLLPTRLIVLIILLLSILLLLILVKILSDFSDERRRKEFHWLDTTNLEIKFEITAKFRNLSSHPISSHTTVIFKAIPHPFIATNLDFF